MEPVLTMPSPKICRACLCEDEKMNDMSEDDVYRKFHLFANIKVEDEIPNVPFTLCETCMQKLNVASSDFKEQCLKSHEILLSRVCNVSEVKLESIDVDTDQVPRLEEFSYYQVLEAIKELRRNLYNNKNCIWCTYIGDDSKALSLHVSEVHEYLKSRWCSACNAEFDNLFDHVAAMHSDMCTCKFCGKKFSDVEVLTKHTISHSGVEPFSCSFCGKSFSTQRYLNMHLKEHTKKKLYKCGNCDKSFNEMLKLNDHLKLHVVKHSFAAEPIRKTLRSDRVVHKRQKFVDADWEPYLCEVCGKGFDKLDSVKTHLKVHNVEPKICCEICNKMYSPFELRMHLQTHNEEKPFVCAKCGKFFISKSFLDQHSRSHSDVRPYRCGACNQAFKFGSGLEKHMLSHLERKQYRCSQCSYTFRNSSHLTQHMKKHAADRLNANRGIVCLLCNDTFATDAILKIHINTHSVSFLDI